MVTFINGGTQLTGALANDAISLMSISLANEGWTIASLTSTSFTASNGIMHFDFEYQSSGLVSYAIDATAPTTKLYEQDLAKASTFTNWLNITAHDGLGNFSNLYYNLAIDTELSRLYAAISPNNFAICIGSLGDRYAWDGLYCGMLDEAYDADSWGIGFTDCRLRLHQIYKSAHDNALWDMVGSRFDTISSSASSNLGSNLSADRLSFGNRTYNAPIHGLLDYFTTFSEQYANNIVTGILETSTYEPENLRANCIYGSINAIDDCAVVMPAFYLEGRANTSSYGSSTTLALAPQLYYRGNLPFTYSGGLSYPNGLILQKDDTYYISTGLYCKLIMRIA